MWHAYGNVFYGFWLGCATSMVATVVCFFLFMHVSTLWFVIPQFAQYLLVFPILFYVFASATYLVLCGTKNVLLAFVVFMPSSHNIITSLCCCSVECFILGIIILRYDYKPALNIVVRKLFVVSTCKTWTNFWICS
jgi:hypothetical protein